MADHRVECVECGAAWREKETCESDFHQMLFWEAERPAYGVVHHLTVLCYHLQHPTLYSPEGLAVGLKLLVDFVASDLTPQEARTQFRARLAPVRRTFKIAGTPESHGSYAAPVAWTMRAGDVMRAGIDRYPASVRYWADTILDALQTGGHLAAD